MEKISQRLEELAELLNDKKAADIIEQEAIGSFSSDDFMSILDNELLTCKGKEVLAEICSSNPFQNCEKVRERRKNS